MTSKLILWLVSGLSLVAVILSPSAFSAEPTQTHPALVSQTVPQGLGVNIHFYHPQPNELVMLDELGVDIVRMDLDWAHIEREIGVYDFSDFDELVNAMDSIGVRVLAIIDYSNPLYDNGMAPRTDATREAYARFVAAAARRYRGKRIVWELWNEPEQTAFWRPEPNVDDYMRWVKAVVPAIRQADPDACIIGPASFHRGLLEECFKRGLLEFIDGVSVHPYRADWPPATVWIDYAQLRGVMQRYHPTGEVKPIICSEWGYSSPLGGEVTREEQADFLVRMWLTNILYGVPISIWYDWHDDGRDRYEGEHNSGTVTYDFQPKPAYLAAQTMIKQLSGYHLADRLVLSPATSGMPLPANEYAVTYGPNAEREDFLLVFRKADKTKLVCWTTGEPHEVQLEQQLSVSACYDVVGNPAKIYSDGRLQLTSSPHYLILDRSIPTPNASGPTSNPNLLSKGLR